MTQPFRARKLVIAAVMTSMLLLTAACGDVIPKSGAHDNRTKSSTKDLVTATVTGHIYTDGNTVYPNGGTVDQTADLSWTIVYRAQSDGFSSMGNPTWKMTQATGTVTWHGSPNLSCSGTLSADPALQTGDLSAFLDVSPGVDNFTVQAAVPTKKIIDSSDTNPTDAQCNTGIAVDFLGDGPVQGQSNYAAWSRILAPQATFKVGQSGSLPLSFDWSGDVPNSPPGEKVTVTDRANVTLSIQS